MTEREPSEIPYQKTADYTVADKPFHWRHGVFRIRVYEKPDAVPIVLAAPLSPGPKRAVISVTPCLSADVLGRHFTRRLGDEEPMRWIEEGLRLHRRRGKETTEREHWQVSFISFVPKRARVWGEEALLLTEQGRRRRDGGQSKRRRSPIC